MLLLYVTISRFKEANTTEITPRLGYCYVIVALESWSLWLIVPVEPSQEAIILFLYLLEWLESRIPLRLNSHRTHYLFEKLIKLFLLFVFIFLLYDGVCTGEWITPGFDLYERVAWTLVILLEKVLYLFVQLILSTWLLFFHESWWLRLEHFEVLYGFDSWGWLWN